jgi:hypothetical protein
MSHLPASLSSGKILNDARSRFCAVRKVYGTNARLPVGANGCVLVPIRMENRLRFSARLHDGAPDVRFERAVQH